VKTTQIRDPIHGPIAISAAEQAIIDSPYVQRLRNIKQLGFSELTFPGAGHSRFLHSLGAMHLAGLAFDAVLREAPWLQGRERQRLRQTVRLAALCHDLGHPPLSHSSEVLLPPGNALRIPHLLRPLDGGGSHEHFTLQFLLASGLADLLRTTLGDLGIEPQHIAALISEDVACDAGVFTVGGRNLYGLLTALVSSELDVDRMDYLLRDSYFTGVSYGKYDVDWLTSHLCAFEDAAGRLHLGLEDRAIFTFDDFLLSRHHMFLMVYFHKKSVCYDHMLRRFYEQFPGDCAAPADPEAYLHFDDHALWRVLRQRQADSIWADGILRRRPLPLIAESTATGREPIAALVERLTAAGIDHLHVTSKGALSKYHAAHHAPSIYVRQRPPVGEPRWVGLSEATQLFERYADHTVLERIYVHPADAAEAGAWLAELRAQGA
jgi:HD superfamily phosphohydrolase